MASPQSPISAPPRDTTPELLTPRSKIKALLATVESSDDEDSGQVMKTTKTLSPRKPPIFPRETPQENDDDHDSDSDVPQIRPRGKLASRMQGLTTTAENSATTTITATDESTIDISRDEEGHPVEQSGQTGGAQGQDNDENEDENEDDDLPVGPRRLQRRVARSPSPGLFVSSPARPSPSKNVTHSGSEDDLPAVKSDRFKALVERKRQERLAREQQQQQEEEEEVEAARDAERRALQELGSDDDNVSSIADDEGGLKLTQTARPQRRAGKKAIEEMNRETQRMARNMQLSHEAKTRKKVTKASLFDRFNYKPAGETPLPPQPPVNSSSGRTSPKSDEEAGKEEDTPPSSPPVGEKQDAGQKEISADVPMDDAEEDDLPTLAEVMSSSPPRIVDKGKGKMPAVEPVELPKTNVQPKRQVRVRLPMPNSRRMQVDSDDELEVTTTARDKINAVFNNVPLKKDHESHAIQALRALALVKSPSKDSRRKKDQDGMTPGELQSYLQQKAREQAKVERDKRLDMLKAQGVSFQTAEERERQIQEVEDFLAKAREEGERIMNEEKAAAKKEKKEDGEVDPLAWDSSDDEDYEEGVSDVEEGSAIELSGSEEEGEDMEDEDMEDGRAEVAEDAASLETEALKPALSDVEADAGDAEELPTMRRRRARKQATLLSDDEDEMTIEATPETKTPAKKTPNVPTSDPVAPTSVLRSAKKTFIPGLPVQGPAGLGLTQIFAGTMDDSQMSLASGPSQSMMPDFSQFPDSNFSDKMDDGGDDMILDSQQDESLKETQGIKLNLSQSQMRGLDSLLRDDSLSQYSQSIIYTQDGGLQDHTPLRQRFVEQTQSTVNAGTIDLQGFPVPESPVVQRGRLRRKMDIPQATGQSSTMTGSDHDHVLESSDTAFNILKDGAKKEQKRQLISDFNKKKSKARDMIEEQAEESEDEYAGLGGVDGEDSDDESNASVDEIIDDAAGNDVDERKLAAFFNDREREKDEKQIEKLYKDIASGMLRRKRGADYDLSDSDDGGEARRRMKRRQFAKMQKALFADERVKKIAQDPGNQAFLRTIEDQGSDEEIGLLDVVDAPGSQSEETLSRENSAPVEQQPQLQANRNNQLKESASSAAAVEGRLPAHLRRTKDRRKPSNLGEVRETLSDLLEQQHSSVVPATEADPDSDEERPATSEALNYKPPSPRRNANAVVDRMSRKRTSSSTTSGGNRLAFTAPGVSSSSSFKVPALLRRATTNSSLISSTTTGSASAASSSSSTNNTTTATTTNSGGLGADTKIKKGAGKKSGVHGFTRDSERNARMQENERRREERKIKGAESRAGLVGGLLGKGSFE